MHCMLIKFVNRKLLSGLLLSSIIFFPTVALAKYSPIKRVPPKESSRSGGKRGCPGEEKISLTVLAPHTFVGKTASVRPTLAWFSSKPQETEVHVYEFDRNNKVSRTVAIAPISKSQTKAGINKLKLPQNNKLTPGKKYLWQVSIPCVNGGNFMQKAEFEVVQQSGKLKTQLSNVASSSQKVNVYARNDLWYEALEESLQVSHQGKLGAVSLNLLNDLIIVYNNELKKEKVQANKQNIQQQINNLQAILNQRISGK